MTPKDKTKVEPEANGVVPQQRIFNIDLTESELACIRMFCQGQNPLQFADGKIVAGYLHAKIDQLAQQSDSE